MDAVITWVDGSDPGHREKRLARLARAGAAPRSATDETRFAALNEIELCLISILKFAPFLRRIFIVTDDQIPACLDRITGRFPQARDRIRIVDHKVIFAGHEDLLPTFNSTAIETMLFRIPDLDEEYVFFNDDFLILRPLVPEDFFRNGRPQLRGLWRYPVKLRLKLALRRAGVLAVPKGRVDRKELMWRAARLAGLGPRYFFNDHTPHPFRRSVQAGFHRLNPGPLRENARHPFRAQVQFNVAALADHLEIAAGAADFVPARLTYLSPAQNRNSSGYVRRKIARSERDQHQFACIQSLDQCSPEVQAMIAAWLDPILAP